MIYQRLFIHKFCSNSKILLSSSWQYLLERLWLFSPRANFSSFEYLFFLVSTIFSIHTYLVHKSKNKKQLYYRKDWEVSIVLLFVLIQQNTVMFFSYSIRNYNARTLEIWTKDNMWRKIFGEILKGFFVTVEI